MHWILKIVLGILILAIISCLGPKKQCYIRFWNIVQEIPFWDIFDSVDQHALYNDEKERVARTSGETIDIKKETITFESIIFDHKAIDTRKEESLDEILNQKFYFRKQKISFVDAGEIASGWGFISPPQDAELINVKAKIIE